MLGTERAADEPALMINMDLGQIARIVDRLDLFTDEGGEHGFDVTPAHQADAVAQHLARLGHVDEQHVELFKAVGHGGQEPALLPSRDRWFAGAAMLAAMIDAAHECLETCPQLVEREGRCRQRLARDRVSRQVGQEHIVDGAKYPFDLAASARATRQRMDEANFEGDARLLDMIGDEIRAVVDVELFGDAADDPLGVWLAPDCLSQCQRRVKRARRVEGEEVTGDGSAVIVKNDGQPRAHRRAVVIEHEDVEHGMVRLPHLVRDRGFAPMHQFVLVAVGSRIGCDRDLACRYRSDDTRDGRVAWCPVPFRNGEFLHLSVDGSDRGPRALDGEIAGKPGQMVRQMQPAPVGGRDACETGETFGSVAGEPALQCPFAHRDGASEVRKRNAIGQMRLKDAIALDR